MSKTVNFITLGCKVNQYETDGMAEQMRKAGYQVVSHEDIADITVINTCAVTNIAERKSRQMIRRVKKQNPNSIVVAAGCYVQNIEKTLDDLPEVDIFLGNNQKNELVSFLGEYEKNHSKVSSVVDINHTNEYENFFIESTEEHTRAYIKIQDGCNQFCSYCIIPYVRGRVRSRALSDIVAEARELGKKGFKEVVLTGIHISSYGTDFTEQSSLLELLQALNEVEEIKRIRLGSLEPRIITEEFVLATSQMEKLCPHFHLSLQSGCDATLKRMNRKYTTQEYRLACERLRKYFSHPAITTDVIVGFPGETVEEFETTMQYLTDLQLYETHIFKYSIREGTVAADMPQQVDGNSKHERSERLLALNEKNKHIFLEAFAGQEAQVLIEEEKIISGVSYYVGATKNYIKIAIPKVDKDLRSGEIVDVFVGKDQVAEYTLALLK